MSDNQSNIVDEQRAEITRALRLATLEQLLRFRREGRRPQILRKVSDDGAFNVKLYVFGTGRGWQVVSYSKRPHKSRYQPN